MGEEIQPTQLPHKYGPDHFVTEHGLEVEPHLALCELISSHLRVTCIASLIIELLTDDTDAVLSHFQGN